MSNGCGYQSDILKFIKPPYYENFYIPCCIHDDDYDRGGDRKKADQNLFRNCLRVISRDETNPWKMIWMTGWAFVYYLSVRIFGRFYFNYGIQS